MQIGESTQFGEPEIYSFGNWLKKERQRGKKNSDKKKEEKKTLTKKKSEQNYVVGAQNGISMKPDILEFLSD